MTDEIWEVEMLDQLQKLNSQPTFDACFDEQHSRPQRKVYGHAPYVTSTLMNGEGRV